MEKDIIKVIHHIEQIEKSWEYSYEFLDELGKKVSKKTHLRSVSPEIGSFLSFLILVTKSKKILELGCSAGYSTLWMALSAMHLGGKIYTTEIMESKIKLAESNFIKAKVEGIVTLLKGDILDILRDWNEGDIDFIFIDANKEDYLKYYESVLPFLKSGGIIVADNIFSHRDELGNFCKKISMDNRVNSCPINVDSGLLLIYKK